MVCRCFIWLILSSAWFAWASKNDEGVCKDNGGSDCGEEWIPANGVFQVDVQRTLKGSDARWEHRLFETHGGGHHVTQCDEIHIFNETSGGVLHRFKILEGPQDPLMVSRFAYQDVGFTKDYLFFIDHQGDSQNVHGTWLVGDKLGEDSGKLFLKPTLSVVVPVNTLAGDGGPLMDVGQWTVLRKSGWVKRDEIKSKCVDGKVEGWVLSAKYRDRTNKASADSKPPRDVGQLHSTLLVQTERGKLHKLQMHHSSALRKAPTGPFIPFMHLDADTGQWLPFIEEELKPDRMVKKGQPYFLQSLTGAPSCVGVAVGLEWLDTAYRVFFHCTDMNVGNERYAYVGWDGWAAEDQVTKDVLDTVSVNRLEAAPLHLEKVAAMKALANAKSGDYFWVFYSHQHDGRKTVSEMLMKCTAGGSPANVTQFSFWAPDRNVIMRTDHADYFTRRVVFHSTSENLLLYETTPAHGSVRGKIRELALLSVSPMGDDPVRWIVGYLQRVDGAFGGLPSCFLYHGALGLPPQFVYAAEILCVFMGHKLAVMVQVDSVSESQTKFPLVNELMHAGLDAINFYNSPESLSPGPQGVHRVRRGIGLLHDDLGTDEIVLDLDVRSFSYANEKTIVLYRPYKGTRVVEALRPHGKAQALHIVPYVDEEKDKNNRNKVDVSEEQYRNSFWNGWVLGYPLRFIESYVVTIGGEDIPTARRMQLHKLMSETVKEAEREGDGMPLIKAGNTHDILSEVLPFYRPEKPPFLRL